MDTDTLILKLIWRVKRTRMINKILKEKNKVGLQDILKATVIQSNIRERTNRSTKENREPKNRLI